MSLATESVAHRRVRLGSVEPAVVTLLKSLDPVIVALVLFTCELLYNDRVTPALAAYGTLAYMFTGQLFDRLEIRNARDTGQSFSNFSYHYARILMQWLATIALLLLGAFAFKVSSDLSRRVVLTWFMVTPVALSAAHALRLRLQWLAVNGASAQRYIIVGVNDVGFELARRLPPVGFHGYFDFRSIERLSSKLDEKTFAGH